MAQTFWHIRNCSLFGRLSEPQLQQLESWSRLRKFPKGSSIYLPADAADSAFLLADGRVRLCSNTPEGKQSILAFIEAGELFGELALIETGEREERAEAVTNATVLLIPGNLLRSMMETSAPLTLGVTKLIGMRRKRIERRLKSLLFHNNRDRLTHLLTELIEQYGSATTEGIELNVRMSHQDMASVIGATRETVTTLLGEMQSEGLVRISRQKLIVLDLPRLTGAASASPLNHSPSPPRHPPSSPQPLAPRPITPLRES
jgi:CRP-like cAMP-binding protein